MNLLSVESLDLRFGDRNVLSGISLAVPANGLVAILGRNGVGKTTLLRTISGLYRPAAGRIAFDGESIGGLPPHKVVARGIAQAPEGRQLFADLSVEENLRAGARGMNQAAYRRERDRLRAMFPILDERSTQLAGSLSGGEQQMLCIARALMARPRLLLLDEPSLGLAPKMVARVFEKIDAIRAGGVAVLLVEQNARLALMHADHAYVLDQGRMVLEGPARALIADERVVAAYLGGA
ncbi:MAG: ABC transporter ATP-binding protein [Betaproteobacteria bacterium]|nr:ABC transporter ATP-binding protein [Betaproteobacteria bacterium]